MSTCPNCNEKLHITDWKPNCPHCGANLNFYGFEERFYEDAKKSELSLAKTRVNWTKFKTGFIGSKFAKIRLAVMLLPLLATLIPGASCEVVLPFSDETLGAGLLGLFSMNSSGSLSLVFQMMSSELYGDVFSAFVRLIVAVALVLVASVLIFFTSLLPFTSMKKTSAINCTLSVIGMLFSAVAAVFAIMFVRNPSFISSDSILTGHMGAGAFVWLVMFAVVFVVNRVTLKQGIECKFKEGDLERVKIAKQVKHGEIKLSDLPYPIVETADTRALQAKIEADNGKLYEQAINIDETNIADVTDETEVTVK